MNYDEAVTEARRLVKRSDEDQWRLAELTFEAVEAGTSRAQWARDVGVSESSAIRWYKMWRRYYQVSSADRPSWSEAFAEQTPTLDDDRASSAVKKASPKKQAEIVGDLIENSPEVREAAQAAILRSAPEPRSGAREWDKAWGETKLEVNEERSAHGYMLSLSLSLSGLRHYQPEDLLSHADQTELTVWERDLDYAVPFLTELRQAIKNRTSKKLQVV